MPAVQAPRHCCLWIGYPQTEPAAAMRLRLGLLASCLLRELGVLLLLLAHCPPKALLALALPQVDLLPAWKLLPGVGPLQLQDGEPHQVAAQRAWGQQCWRQPAAPV